MHNWISFVLMDYEVEFTTGGVVTSDADKKRLAKAYLAYNCKMKMFLEHVEKYEQMSEQPASDSKESPASANLVERRKVLSSDGKTMTTREETSRQEASANPRNLRKSSLARGLLLEGARDGKQPLLSEVFRRTRVRKDMTLDAKETRKYEEILEVEKDETKALPRGPQPSIKAALLIFCSFVSICCN